MTRPSCFAPAALMAATLLGSLAACGGGRGGATPEDVALPDGLGARHPNVGRLAPNFAAQDKHGDLYAGLSFLTDVSVF